MPVSNGDKFNAITFLKVLAEMADGEVEKDFPFEVLWTKSKISAVSEEYFKKDILSWLDAQRLLINQDDRLKITDSGINSVSDFWDIPPNTLGILSREELNKFSHLLIE